MFLEKNNLNSKLVTKHDYFVVISRLITFKTKKIIEDLAHFFSKNWNTICLIQLPPHLKEPTERIEKN